MGNGLSSYEQNDNSLVYFAYYHGLLGNRYGMGTVGQSSRWGRSQDLRSVFQAPNILGALPWFVSRR